MRALVCIALLQGCLAYNPDCVTIDDTLVGYTQTSLDLRKTLVRTGEAPVGNLIADAFYDFLEAQGAQLALTNAGGIRDLNACGRPALIDRGPVYLSDLAAMLPFDNDVTLVRATGTEIIRALEHGVARLGEPGPIGQSGRFLQVSHLQFTVDCDAPAQESGQVGQRIHDLALVAGDGSLLTLDTPEELDASYLVATNSFIASGGDGFEWLNNGVPDSPTRSDFATVGDLIGAAPEQTVAPEVEGRIDLSTSCLPP